MQTKRPLNKCSSCGDTWHPRGRNLSIKCPTCGSTKTKKIEFGITGAFFLLLLFMVFFIFSGENKHTDNTTSLPVEKVETQEIKSVQTSEVQAEPSKDESSREYSSTNISDTPQPDKICPIPGHC